MARCTSCNVTVLDDAGRCPLCGSELVEDGGARKEAIYPVLDLKPRKLIQISQSIALMGIMIEVILVMLNLAMDTSLYWCVITGASIAYTILVMYITCIPYLTLRKRFLILSLGLLMIGLAIDWVIGFSGWAISVIMPIQILFMDVVILILFLTHRKEFQPYIWMTGLNLLLSMIPLLAFLIGYRIFFGMMIIAIGVTFVELVVISALGGRKTPAEFKRRFHA